MPMTKSRMAGIGATVAVLGLLLWGMHCVDLFGLLKRLHGG